MNLAERSSSGGLRRWAAGGLLGTALVIPLGGCAGLAGDPPPKALAEAAGCTRPAALAALVSAASEQQPGYSGIRVLDTGSEAFRVRAALIEAAACSIDAQYYIWNSDASGRYLASRLRAAADRGVQVRLLLDDINIGQREDVLAALARHPHVEIQIYNPFSERRGPGKALNFLWEFTRLNRRMHNKSFTVDRALTIVGGRNIGDEYFDAHPELNFRDRDVLAAGPVVMQTAAMFEEFWNWNLTRPIAELAGPPTPLDETRMAARLAEATRRMTALHDDLPLGQKAGLHLLRADIHAMGWSPARLVFDSPPELGKLGETAQPQNSSAALHRIGREARAEILIESAYLVLEEETLANVAALRRRGVRVRALTNSLASNDVTANHAAYARSRPRLLQHGIELHELRPDALSCASIIRNEAACGESHVFGLHAKTFVIDRRTVYVGSLNMNLRSRYLNAESGLVIENSELAEQIAGAIEENMRPGNSWRLTLHDDARLSWSEDTGEGTTGKRYDTEPYVGWLRRLRAALIAALPLEKYL